MPATTGHANCFKSDCECALPAAPTGLDQRPALPTVHPPHGRMRDLPLVVFHCDAIPANAASQICLINVTPILCPLTFARKASGRTPLPFFIHLQAASGHQRNRHRPRCRCFGRRSWLYISARRSSLNHQRACGQILLKLALLPPAAQLTGASWARFLPHHPTCTSQPSLLATPGQQYLAHRDLHLEFT